MSLTITFPRAPLPGLLRQSLDAQIAYAHGILEERALPNANREKVQYQLGRCEMMRDVDDQLKAEGNAE